MSKIQSSLKQLKGLLEDCKNNWPDLQVILVPSIEDFGPKTFPKREIGAHFFDSLLREFP